jgi:hypothetical protein
VKLKGHGLALREVASGIGFVDVIVIFSSGSPHVVELKILNGRAVTGPTQLAIYMKQLNRTEGWLVFLDARKIADRKAIAPIIKRTSGTIKTITIDINPIPPSKVTNM